MKPCLCGSGHMARAGDWHSDCKVECACGCGGRARYSYAPGHRPDSKCERCGKGFAALGGDPAMCSQCRRHVRDGGPTEMKADLARSRRMQKNAPSGRRWCSGCEKYRAVRFFARKGDSHESRCKPCQKRQQLAQRAKKTYGISIEQYDEIKARQGGACAVCGVATGATRALAIDHDHSCCPAGGSCGQCVRGLLCSPCNKMLGFARDRVEFFERAIEYLQAPPAHGVIERVKPDGQD
jgi:hypothetical protein